MAASLRIDLAQYRELEAFSQFSSDLDSDTRKKLIRGQKLVEILIQPNYEPLGVEEQVIAIFSANIGVFDEVALSDISKLEKTIFKTVKSEHNDLLLKIRNKEKLSKEDFDNIKHTIEEYLESIVED